MVDDDQGRDGPRQGVISESGLGVHQGDGLMRADFDLLNGNQVDFQPLHHGPVFRPENRSAISDSAANLEQLAQEVFQRRRAGQGIRIGSVMGQDQ